MPADQPSKLTGVLSACAAEYHQGVLAHVEATRNRRLAQGVCNVVVCNFEES